MKKWNKLSKYVLFWYGNIYIHEYYLNNMDLSKNPINLRKKISLNINASLLHFVEELAKLTKSNNTLVIESLLIRGAYPLTRQFKDSWTAILSSTKDSKMKEVMNKLLGELKTISEKEEFKPFMEA